MSRILIADDHFFLRTGVEAFLSGAGHEVVASVADGEAALQAMASPEIELAILDLRMPSRSGLEVLKALRRAGDRRPVIILAAEMDDEDLLAIFQAGANAILFKHCAEERLLTAIDQVCAGGNFIQPNLMARIAGTAAGNRPPAETASRFPQLNERENEIVALVAKGQRNRDIALAIGTTEGTVKSYLHGIFRKLGLENRASLAAFAMANAGHGGERDASLSPLRPG